ncbi:hypothetical protein BGX38DRAFT_1326563 [Terfezia claveryi]|nr:hypothetical protein BGX38DRAFT_1326563 [Terfezia claveryi]
MPSYTLRTLSPLRRLYYRFRTYRFPWRKRFFIGQDLSGNTYWELRDRLHPSRPRRMVEFAAQKGLSPRDLMAQGVSSPQWHQWLRNLRSEPPSIDELVSDERRREGVLERARKVEERWVEGRGRRIEGGVGLVGDRMGGMGWERLGLGEGGIRPVDEAPQREKVTLGTGEKQVVEGEGKGDPWEEARREQEQEGPMAWVPQAGKR